MTKVGGIAAEQLNQIIERIERLEAEKSQIMDHIRDVYAEAKYNGFDIKILRQVIRLRKMNPQQREEQQELLDLYKAAVGMSV